MSKIYINELNKYYNQTITIDAFVDSIRDLQPVQFVILRDGTGKVQMTIEKSVETNLPLVDIISKLTLESTVKVTGKLVESPNVKLNGMEFIPTDIIVTSTSLAELPIDIKDKNKTLRETRLDYRFLDLRREENNLLFKCQTTIEHAMREYWYQNNYIEIASPKISGASAEGGSEVFKLDYFGMPACLSQSPQLYKQMAMAAGFDKVFEIAPAFRAEASHTSYHATEILMVDTEISWINSVNDVMDMEEAWLKYIFNDLSVKHADAIQKTFKVTLSDMTKSFPRVTFMDAKAAIKDKFNYVAANASDLERKEEELICKWAKEQYGSDFIFITNYPVAARPFYTMAAGDGTTNSYDLLYKGIEITSGAQREHRHDLLKQQIIDKGINPDTLADYLSFFKYGCPPHGGFGFGLGRLIMSIFEIDNIREATFVYRGPTRLNP